MRLPRSGLLKNRGLISVAVLVILGGTGVGLWLGLRSPAAATTTTTSIVTVSYGTIQQTVSATGTIEPTTQSNVNFAVTGKVTAVDVSVGQTVSQGETLAQVDSSALTASLAADKETLAAAEARFSADQSSSAPSAQLASDQAAVTSAQNQVNTAQQLLDDATLTAPIAGTVASVSLAVGQEVSGGGGGGNGGGSAASSSGSSSGEIVIINTGSWLVTATVNDSSIGQLTKGLQAQVIPQGSSTTVYGTVGSIGLIASSTSGVASFPVVIDITGDPSGLYAGTSANVNIIVKQLTNVLVIPSAALKFSSAGPAVTVVRNGKDVTEPVGVGVSSGGDVQITSGLNVGDQVVETIVHQGTTRTNSNGTGGTGRFGNFGGGLGGGLGGGGGFTTFGPGG